MKRFLFIYRDDRDAYCDPDFEVTNRLHSEEREFPAGTTDREILEAARRLEVKDRYEDHNTASEGVFNRALLRIIQIARDIPILP